MFKKSLLFLFLLSPSLVIAAELPFTDVSLEASYYAPLKHMYAAEVIGDTVDHLFHPDGLLPRDEFVGITVGVSCKKCISPSIEDIIHYRENPFIDILKKNQYFYCISYAKEKEIVRGYTLDSNRVTQCQNKQSFSEVPFCGANNITRIEAASVLLRQAGIWNESYNNSPYEKKIILPDVDSYWYGYAQKAVELGLITLSTDKKIFPNEYITRKEFVIMASKIFSINMCQVKNNNQTPSGFASAIKIFDKERVSTSPSEVITTFPNTTETIYDFGGYATGVINPPLQYDWTFTNTTTGEQKFASGSYLDNYNLESAGLWIVKLVITDVNGRNSTSYQQVSVNGSANSGTNSTNNTGDTNNAGLSLQIGMSHMSNSNATNNIGNRSNSNVHSASNLIASASSLNGMVGVPVPFFSRMVGGDGNYSYNWTFSDGGIDTTANPSHIFMQEGVYPVSLFVHDGLGNVAYAQIIVIVSKNHDRDGDGVLDYNSDGSILDMCPDVFGPASNNGCPFVTEYNSWGIVNGANTANTTNTNNSINNLCLSNKIQTSGMIEGSVQCTTCPCVYSSEFIAQVRSCDIIFPSITSPDKKTLYSRGSIFQIP